MNSLVIELLGGEFALECGWESVVMFLGVGGERGMAQGRLARHRRPEMYTALGGPSRLSCHGSSEPPAIAIFIMPTDMFYRLRQPVNYIVDFIWMLFKD